jgi:hypothetical protein
MMTIEEQSMRDNQDLPLGIKLYTTPPTAQPASVHDCFWKNEGYKECPAAPAPEERKRPWVGLTDEEIDKTHETQVWDARQSYARAIEAKLKAKNSP